MPQAPILVDRDVSSEEGEETPRVVKGGVSIAPEIEKDEYEEETNFRASANKAKSVRISTLGTDIQAMARTFSIDQGQSGDISTDDLTNVFKNLMVEQDEKRAEAEKREEAEREKARFKKIAITSTAILGISYLVIFFTVFGVTSMIIGSNNSIIGGLINDAQLFEINDDGTIGRKNKGQKVKTKAAIDQQDANDIWSDDFDINTLESMDVYLGTKFRVKTSLKVTGYSLVDRDTILLYTDVSYAPAILMKRDQSMGDALSAESLKDFFEKPEITLSNYDIKVPTTDELNERALMEVNNKRELKPVFGLYGEHFDPEHMKQHVIYYVPDKYCSKDSKSMSGCPAKYLIHSYVTVEGTEMVYRGSLDGALPQGCWFLWHPENFLANVFGVAAWKGKKGCWGNSCNADAMNWFVKSNTQNQAGRMIRRFLQEGGEVEKCVLCSMK